MKGADRYVVDGLIPWEIAVVRTIALKVDPGWRRVYGEESEEEKQAAAATGMIRLAHAYQEVLAVHAEGSLEAEKLMVLRSYDRRPALECFALLVRQLLQGRLHALTFEAEPRIVLHRARRLRLDGLAEAHDLHVPLRHRVRGRPRRGSCRRP